MIQRDKVFKSLISAKKKNAGKISSCEDLLLDDLREQSDNHIDRRTDPFSCTDRLADLFQLTD